MKSRRRRSLTEIFQAPLVIFILTLAGLISALITEGGADLWGAMASGSALLVLLWLWLKPKRQQ